MSELTALPAEAFHRNVDEIVLATDPKGAHGVHTAIVCPPTIYGEGRGPVSRRGRQVYELASLILAEKYAPIIGQGKARWNNVHVHDLSDVFLRLVQIAASVKKIESAVDLKETWGEKGYYFTENGEHEWGATSRDLGTFLYLPFSLLHHRNRVAISTSAPSLPLHAAPLQSSVLSSSPTLST